MEFKVIDNTLENRFIRHDMNVIVNNIPFFVLMIKLKHADKTWRTNLQ